MRYRLALLLALLAFVAAACEEEDTGWVIDRFDAAIQIQPDGSLEVVESVTVDFQGLQRHGIFRNIPELSRYAPDDDKLRRIDVRPQSVTDFSGAPVQYTYDTTEDGVVSIRIGDPNVTVTGVQEYRITYAVLDALDSLADADELYWNVTGNDWTVPIAEASSVVTIDAAPFLRGACYQGPAGSTERCASATIEGMTADFTAGRELDPGEGLTIAAAFPKGSVPVRPPVLIDRPREFGDFVDPQPWQFPVAVLGFLAVAGWAFHRWRTAGRDQRYLSATARGGEPGVGVGVASGDEPPVVTEYEPPDGLRPAEIGALIDTKADTVDISATIVDLAARGYIQIAEIEKDGLFGGKDYELTRLKAEDAELLPHESLLMTSLFSTRGDVVRLSDLRKKFYKDLKLIKKVVDGRVLEKGYFKTSPDRARARHAGEASIILLGAGAIAFGLAWFFGAAIAGIGLVIGALVALCFTSAMPARTATGYELYRRSLGFKQFIEVADKSRQEFYEREGIFEKYLPYAMVFGAVDKWAGVFSQLGIEVREPSYYRGSYGAFTAASFSSSFEGFSGGVSTAISSSPGGGSGGGGSSGGGGGGGGGGSW